MVLVGLKGTDNIATVFVDKAQYQVPLMLVTLKNCDIFDPTGGSMWKLSPKSDVSLCIILVFTPFILNSVLTFLKAVLSSRRGRVPSKHSGLW